MSLFRELNEAALSADLSKNEAKVFMALLHQTLGYGKSHDNLTNKRLAYLAGIRQDRLLTAIEGVIDHGLFTVRTARRYNFRYDIPQKFLDEDPVFFTPHLPKNREKPQQTEGSPEIQSVSPNFGTIPNYTLTSFNPNYTLPPLQMAQAPSAKISPPVSPPAPQPQVQPPQPQVQPPQPQVQPPQPPAVIEPVVKTSPLPPSSPSKTVSGVERILQKSAKKERWACTQTFSALSVLQQKRVLEVYENKEKVEVIYSPPKFLSSLILAEQEGRLIVPETVSHASHKPFPSEKTKEEKIKNDRFGQLTWLRDHADSVPFAQFAEEMLMSVYLEDTHFLKHWLGCQAELENTTVEALVALLKIEL
jgi:phage replication O-like protein O